MTVANILSYAPHTTDTGIPFAILLFCCAEHQTEREAARGKGMLEVASPCQRPRSRLHTYTRRAKRCHEEINPRIPRNSNARPSTSKRDTRSAACGEKRQSGVPGPP